MTDCKHAYTKRGKNAPLRWGSYRTEVCKACGAYRTHGHDAARSHLSAWLPASGYAEAVAPLELE